MHVEAKDLVPRTVDKNNIASIQRGAYVVQDDKTKRKYHEFERKGDIHEHAHFEVCIFAAKPIESFPQALLHLALVGP
jgi:hypothetical protein